MALSSDGKYVVHKFSSYPFSEKRIPSTLKVWFICKNSVLDWHDGTHLKLVNYFGHLPIII